MAYAGLPVKFSDAVVSMNEKFLFFIVSVSIKKLRISIM